MDESAVEFLKRQYNFNKQLFLHDFIQAKEMEDKKLQENWEECESRMKQSIYWNNKKSKSKLKSE